MSNRSDMPGWIYRNKWEISDVKRLVSSDIGEGTVDQLGFGVLFDHVSSGLFPWCSTLTTRGKYFLWVPAIIECAVEICKKKIIKDKPDRYHTDLEDDKLENIYGIELQKTINKLESALALCLYYKYQKDSKAGLGMFGKNNIYEKCGQYITKNEHIQALMRRGILSTPERYPSRIYWGSLRNLSICGNEDVSIKRAVQLLAKDESDVWHDDWKDAIRKVRITEIDKIVRCFEQKKGTIDLKFIKDFCERMKFVGFKMEPSLKEFMKKKLVNKADIWKDLLIAKTKNRLETDENPFKYLLAEVRRRKNIEHMALMEEVCHVLEATRPFLEVYYKLINGKTERDCSTYNWTKVRSELSALQKKVGDGKDFNGALCFMKSALATMDRSTMKIRPNKAFIKEIIKREEGVLSARGKYRKKLLNNNKDVAKFGYKSNYNKSSRKNRDQDDEALNVQLRLGKAKMLFKDII